jgi:protein-disulfide isomerase
MWQRWNIARAQGALYKGELTFGSDKRLPIVVEFVDYQCDYCEAAHRQLRRLIDGDKLQLVIRYFPLASHPYAQVAAQASYCAAKAGVGQLAHETLLRDDEWEVRRDWPEFAAVLGISAVADYVQCVSSAAAVGAVEADRELGRRIGVAGTPAFVAGGKLYKGVLTQADLDVILHNTSSHPE